MLPTNILRTSSDSLGPEVTVRMFQYARGGDMAPTRLRIPLLDHELSETPVFTAANLLEGARIRKGLSKVSVLAGCLLDFDEKLVQHLAATGTAVEDSA